MQRLSWVVCCAVAALACFSWAAPAWAADANDPAVGRWDITLGDGPTPCWLEVTKQDGQYAGRFLFVAASVFDLKTIKIDGNKIEFPTIDKDGGDRNVTFTGTIDGDTIKGETINKDGHKGKWSAKRFVAQPRFGGMWILDGKDQGRIILGARTGQLGGMWLKDSTQRIPLMDLTQDGYTLNFTADKKKCSATVKGALMTGTLGDEKFTAKREIRWGEAIELFNGKDLSGWKALGDPNNFKWKVVDGVMHCDGHGSSNIVSEQKFEDFKLHVEFKVPNQGNSGVYLRGRYEIQVADSAGSQPDVHSCAALYSRRAASEDAGKPAGQWQTYDITIIDHYVTVVWNGKTVIDNQELEGITGGAIDSNEAEPGPIYLQGDHTSIDYRKITITPVLARAPRARTSG